MTQIPQVANHQVIHMDDINGIAPMLLTTMTIMIGGHAGDEHIADLILTRSPYNTGIAANGGDIVVVGVIMTDGDDGGVELTQPGKFP